MTARFDRRKPHKQVKDFVTGHTTIYQNGTAYNEHGLVLVGAPVPAKYPCPKCDYTCDERSRLLIHAMKVHQASEALMEAFKTRISNIDHDLPMDEGIDWHKVSISKTQAQVAIDEAAKSDAKDAQANAEEAAKPALTPREAQAQPHKCPSCEFEGRNQQALAAHKRHTHKG